MVAYNKFEDFVNQLMQGNHDFNADTINCYLSNDVPSVSADTIKSELAEITLENGYAAAQDTQQTFAEATGTGTVTGTKIVITAGGGTIGPFQYVVLHNVTDDGLIAWWDYGSALTLQDGETFSIKFNDSDTTGSILTIV